MTWRERLSANPSRKELPLKWYDAHRPLTTKDKITSFWFLIDRSGPCWLWKGAKRNKYGCYKLGPKLEYAHRIAYKLFKGPIPEGRLVCHTCDTPLCVTPSHLFLGNYKDNEADKTKKGRRPKPARGEEAVRSKITEKDALEIRSLSGRIPQSKIAERFGIGQAEVSRIIRKERWSHIP